MSPRAVFLCLFAAASLYPLLVEGIECQVGANYDSDGLFPTDLVKRSCRNPQTVCLRLEATLIRRNEENAQDQVVAAGACALEHECNQSMCTRILSDYWFINYTSVEEGTGSGIEGEYVEIESGMNPLNEEPTFDVRSCELICCKGDKCNKQSIASIKQTSLSTTQATSPGGGSSRLPVGLFAIVTPLFLILRNFYV